MFKFFIASLLIFSINAKASEGYFCSEVYQKRTDALVKKDSKLNKVFGGAGLTSALAFALGSGPFFVVGLGAVGTTFVLGYMSDKKLQNNILIQSAFKEVILGRDAVMAEISSQVEVYEQAPLKSPIEVLVEKVNAESSEPQVATYDSVLKTLQDNLYTETLCPEEKALSMKKFVSALAL